MAAGEDASESEALGLRLKTNVDELSARIEKGDIPPEVNSIALEMGHGEDATLRDAEELHQCYLGQSTSTDSSVNNAFDRDSGDVDAWFGGAIREKEKALPQTPGVLYGYRKRMIEFQRQLYPEHEGYFT